MGANHPPTVTKDSLRADMHHHYDRGYSAGEVAGYERGRLERDRLLEQIRQLPSPWKREDMKVRVNFRQRSPHRNIVKTIELAAMPYPGCLIEYEDGWSMCRIREVYVTANMVGIDEYGPQFTDDEIEKLRTLGWEIY